MSVEIGISRLVFQLSDEREQKCTSFYMPFEEKEYLITAKHFLKKSVGKIRLSVDEVWKELPERIILCSKEKVDIAAIEITGTKLFSKRNLLIPKYTCEDVTIGDDSFFIGFPYGIKSILGFKDRPMLKFTFPIVKRATVSGAIIDNNKNIGFYMDGHNNPGYSGAPCLKKIPGGQWILFGVVSSYIMQENILYDENGEAKMIITWRQAKSGRREYR